MQMRTSYRCPAGKIAYSFSPVSCWVKSRSELCVCRGLTLSLAGWWAGDCMADVLLRFRTIFLTENANIKPAKNRGLTPFTFVCFFSQMYWKTGRASENVTVVTISITSISFSNLMPKEWFLSAVLTEMDGKVFVANVVNLNSHHSIAEEKGPKLECPLKCIFTITADWSWSQ